MSTPSPQTEENESPAPATEAQIAQCLKMLAGPKDEHKFAGLLMVTKLQGMTPEQQTRVHRQVFEIVGKSFLVRLLRTQEPSNAAEPTSDAALSTFQCLGLTLIASFCADASLADHFAEEKTVRYVLEYLAKTADGAEMQPTPVEDCVRILQGVTQTTTGITLLTDERMLGRLCSTIRHMSRALFSSSSSSSSEGEENHGHEETESENKTEEDRRSELEGATEVLWSVLRCLSIETRFWINLRAYDFEFLCSNFSHVHGRSSLNVLAMFNTYMRLVQEEQAPAELLSSRALSDLRHGVLCFLRAKWPQQERDECLQLVYALMEQFGVSWMLPGTTLRCQEPLSDDVCSGKFVLFVLKLAAVEIKLMLDEAELGLVQMEDKKVESIDEIERQSREMNRAMTLLPSCYGIVEMIISGLVANAEEEMVVPYDILLEMRQTFTQVFAVILELLVTAREFMKTHRYQDLLANGSESVFQLDAIVYASVRLISAWIAEDSETSVKEVIDLLPFLVCYSPLFHTSKPTTLAVSDSTLTQIQEPDTDSDDEVDALGQLLQDAADIHNEDAYIDQLHFLLPGLLQISATPQGADVILEDVNVVRRLMRFACTLCADISKGTAEVGDISTLTMVLGILMNILLLRGSSADTRSNSSPHLPHSAEWYRSLSFLLPVACASGSYLMTAVDLTTEERGEDNRYLMLLHVVCVVMLIASHFAERASRPCKLSTAVVRLVQPFRNIVEWLRTHPPSADGTAEAASDLAELCRSLALRTPLVDALQE